MKIGIMGLVAILILAAGWFFVRDDAGRNVLPMMFDNMNERFLIDSQQVHDDASPGGRLVRLRPAASVAHALEGDHSSRLPDEESFARDGSYFESGRSRGGNDGEMPLELGGISRSKDVLVQGRSLFRAHCAVCHGVDGNGQGSMVAYDSYPQVGSFRDEKYASYSPGKMFRSIRLGQGNMPAFGHILSAKEIWCLVAAIREMQSKIQEQALSDHPPS